MGRERQALTKPKACVTIGKAGPLILSKPLTPRATDAPSRGIKFPISDHISRYFKKEKQVSLREYRMEYGQK